MVDEVVQAMVVSGDKVGQSAVQKVMVEAITSSSKDGSSKECGEISPTNF